MSFSNLPEPFALQYSFGSGYSYDIRGGLWSSTAPGTISAAATGSSDVPAFDLGLNAPSPISVTVPAVPETGTPAIPTSSDYTVTWLHGGEGTVEVYLQGYGDTTRTVGVSCVVQASVGQVTIPAAMLALVAPTGLGMVITAQNVAEKQVQDWNMQLAAQSRRWWRTVTYVP